MSVERFVITRREPYGQIFADGRTYERIEGIAHYAVDTDHAANQVITDLALAEKTDGLVRFSGDVTLLVPSDGGNRAMLFEVPNRGNRVLTRMFNQAPFDLLPTDEINSGDGFLMDRGWTLAWGGWQWDVPNPGPRMGLAAPLVPDGAVKGQMQLRVQPDQAKAYISLTDHHVGSIGNHRLIPTQDIDDPEARLLVRDHIYGEAREVPRDQWQFARDEGGSAIPDAEHIWLEGGFKVGQVYDVLYTPRDCPVTGAGLIAARDLASFLRYSSESPLGGTIDYTIAEGISQCGRFLRTFLGLGMNTDEGGTAVFDGMLVHIAGGRRGEFNLRYGQPSVQPTPSLGHRFPFADEPQYDPRTGQTAGLLDAQKAAGNLPKVFYTDTAAEYWRGDASLAHLSVADGADVELAELSRRYHFAGTQHGAGVLPFADISPFGSHGSNYFNLVDYRPLYRAALTNLLAWVAEGIEPPASVYPRQSDGTAAQREDVSAALEKIPGLFTPDPSVLPCIYQLDLGSDTDRGVARLPATSVGSAYPCVVSAVDTDGNEIGGVRMPDVTVPVATHAGFNVRHPDSGGVGQILEYVGLTVPFAVNTEARAACGDPRPSIAERYPNREEYLGRVETAAQELVTAHLLLAEDVSLCRSIAADRYDAIMDG